MISQFFVRNRQIVLASWITPNVLSREFIHFDCYQFCLFDITFGSQLFDWLANNILRWIVVHHFFVLAYHAYVLVAIEIYVRCILTHLFPFCLKLGALLFESWQ